MRCFLSHNAPYELARPKRLSTARAIFSSTAGTKWPPPKKLPESVGDAIAERCDKIDTISS